MAKQEGGPRNNIDFGQRGEWIRLYAERARCSQEYNRLAERYRRLSDSLAERQRGNIQQAFGLLGTMKPTEQGDFLSRIFDGDLARQAAEARAIAARIQDVNIDFTVEEVELNNAAEANDTRYHAAHGQLREKEHAVGLQCHGEIPLYIARAIGNGYPEILENPWIDIRGAVEAFRFVTGEDRPEVTLGRGVKKRWSRDALGHIVMDVQRIQTLQIALSPAPTVTAAAFDRLDTLVVVGEPPDPTNENLTFGDGTWTRAALNHMKAVEPPELGLLMDRQ